MTLLYDYDLVLTLLGFPLLGAAVSLSAKSLFHRCKTRWVEYSGAIIGLLLPWVVLAMTLPPLLDGYVFSGTIGGWNGVVGIAYRFDGLAWLVNLLGFTVAGAAYLYTLDAGPKGPSFTTIFLIQTAALSATAMTADLFNLFVCLEVMGIASYVLITFSNKTGAMLAAFSYLMVSATAMIFFLLGIYGFYRLTGSLSYQGIHAALATLPEGGGITAGVSLALIAGAVAIRVAIMPVYGWLPDAHALAPHGVSAVLSGVLIKTPLFALSRVLLLIPLGASAGQLMGWAGALTALLAVLVALSQTDAKRLLAYHSVSQIGYIVAAWGAALHAGASGVDGWPKTASLLMTAAFLHAFFHAIFKGLLFLTVGTLTDVAGERNVYRLRNGYTYLKAAGERIPVTTVSYFVAALAIAAIPPLNGFASKNYLVYGLKGSWEYGVLFAASMGTVASFIKLSRIFLPGKKSVPSNISAPGKKVSLGPLRRLSQALLASAAIAGGIAAPSLFRLIYRLFSTGMAPGFEWSRNALYIPHLYGFENLKKTALIIAGGILLFILARTKPLSFLLGLIRNRKREFHGLFLAFSAGTVALVLWMLF